MVLGAGTMRPGLQTAARRPPRRAAEWARSSGDCPELDCIRHLLPPATLDWAERRAERLGLGADRALVAAGLLGEEAYIRALAASLSVAFEPLETVPRSSCLLSDAELIDKAPSGLLPIADGAGTAIVIAPRMMAARGLVRLIRSDPALAARFRLTTGRRLNAFLLRAGGKALTRHASDSLRRTAPAMSAASRRGVRAPVAGVAALAIAAAALAPGAAQSIVELTLSAAFLSWLGLRLIGALIGPRSLPPGPDLPDRDLPTYSVIAAVYREAASIDGLLAAIERLDYPAFGRKCTKPIVAI